MNRWRGNRDCISPIFKFSQTARKVMYTTNAIESLNSGFRRLNRSRTVFPNAVGHTKALYLASWELTKKRTLPVRNWGEDLCGTGHYVSWQAKRRLTARSRRLRWRSLAG